MGSCVGRRGNKAEYLQLKITRQEETHGKGNKNKTNKQTNKLPK